MIETQEGPAPAAAPPEPTRHHGSTISGLGARHATEAVPRNGPTARERRAPTAMPWAGAGRRPLAWINLVTAVMMAMAGFSAASGVSAFEAPAAIGRWVGSAFTAPVAEVASRPPVTDLLPYGKGMWIYEPDKT